jgi:hypothetical protein
MSPNISCRSNLIATGYIVTLCPHFGKIIDSKSIVVIVESMTCYCIKTSTQLAWVTHDRIDASYGKTFTKVCPTVDIDKKNKFLVRFTHLVLEMTLTLAELVGCSTTQYCNETVRAYVYAEIRCFQQKA